MSEEYKQTDPNPKQADLDALNGILKPMTDQPQDEQATWEIGPLDPWGWWLHKGRELGFHVGGSNPEDRGPAQRVADYLNALAAENKALTTWANDANAASTRYEHERDDAIARAERAEAALRQAGQSYHLVCQGRSETGAHSEAETFMTCRFGRCPEFAKVLEENSQP